jgi:hypothetical protein
LPFKCDLQRYSAVRVADPAAAAPPNAAVHPREVVGVGSPQPPPTPVRATPGDARTRCSAGAPTADPLLPFGDEFVGALELNATGGYELRLRAAGGDNATVGGTPLKIAVVGLLTVCP